MYPDQARGSNCAFLGFIIFPTSLDFNNIPRTIIMEARQWTVTCGGQGGGQSPVLWGDSGTSDTGMVQGRGRMGAGAAWEQGSWPEERRCDS